MNRFQYYNINNILYKLDIVDDSMLLEASDTNVLSMIVRDIDIEVDLSLLLLITSDKLSVTETITKLRNGKH